MTIFIIILVLIAAVVLFFQTSERTARFSHGSAVSRFHQIMVIEPIVVLLFWGFSGLLYRALWDSRIINSATYGTLANNDWRGTLGRTWIMVLSMILLIRLWKMIPRSSSRWLVALFVVVRWLMTFGIVWLWTHDGILEWAIVAVIVYVLGSIVMLVVGTRTLVTASVQTNPASDSPFEMPMVYGNKGLGVRDQRLEKEQSSED